MKGRARSCANYLIACLLWLPVTVSNAQTPTGSEIAWFLDDDTKVQQIEYMQRLYSDDELPPAGAVGWVEAKLPDVWFRERRQIQLSAWYQTNFDTNDAEATSWSLFIPRVSAHAEFWLNGQYIGETSRRTDPLPNMWNYPVLVQLPSNVLLPKDNRLEVFLTVQTERLGNLYELYVGPTAELEPLHNVSHFGKVTAAQGVTVIMLMTALMLAFLCFLGNQPASYKWFLVGAIFWALYSMHLYVAYIPFSSRLWHGIHNVSLFASIASFIVATHRMLELKRRVIEGALCLMLLYIVYSSIFYQEINLAFISSVSLFGTWTMALYLGLLMIIHGMRNMHTKRWIIAPGIGVFVLTVWDVSAFGLQHTAIFNKYALIPVIALVTGGAVFLTKTVRTQRQVGQLEKSQQATAAIAVAQERERLMREIHDGVGGQLVSTLSLLESERESRPEIVDALRSSLSDLRMVISSLETVGQEGNLVSLLATLRDRMEQFLAPHKIELVWGVQPLPELKNFGSDESLHVMRIVQEAVTNVIKHSHASYVRIACDEETDSAGVLGVYVEISNDGVEHHAPQADEGFGLENIHSRASALGGDFHFSKNNETAVAKVWIPVDGRV